MRINRLCGVRIRGPQAFHRTFLLILAVSGFCAFLILLWSTPFGVGASTDSTIYVDTARSLLEGDGFQSHGKPLTHFPPVYPLLVAVSGLFGMDPLEGARWLHALLYALNVSLVGIIAYVSTNRSVTGGLCSILLFLSSGHMLEIHGMAWSEPPFIFFSLSALFLLTLHIARPRVWTLLASSFSLGLALTTRYVGLSLFPPMILCILLFGRKQVKPRIKDSLVLLAIGMSPLTIWLLRNVWVAHSATDRTLSFHPIGLAHLESLGRTVGRLWLSVDRIPFPLVLFAIGLVLAGFLLVLRDKLRGKVKLSVHTTVQTIAFLFFVTYVLFLFASISFADAHTPIDARTLSPVYVLGVIFLISVSWSVSHLRGNPGLWWGFLAFSAVLIGLNSAHALSWSIYLRNEGIGYTNRMWRNSESIAFIESLPKGVRIYSNGGDVIRLLTGRKTVVIPFKTSPEDMSVNLQFGRDVSTMRHDLTQSGALIVYFDNITGRPYYPGRQELEDLYQIPLLFRLRDGAVYGVRNPGGQPP